MKQSFDDMLPARQWLIPVASTALVLGILAAFIYKSSFAEGTTRINHPSAFPFIEKIIDDEPLAGRRMNEIQIADFDGDGRPDIWVSGRNASSREQHQSAWYRNPGDRGSAWSRNTILAGSWKYGAAGDLDGDGDPDLVADQDDEWQDGVFLLLNDLDVSGEWSRVDPGIVSPAGKEPDLITIADFDNDGKNEIVVMFKNAPIHIYRRPETAGNPWPATEIRPRLARGKTTAGGSVGDVDGDGLLDVVYGVCWYRNPGRLWTEGENWAEEAIDAGWAREARSGVGDIDGDGKPDVVLSSEEGDEGIAWYGDPKATGRWKKHLVTRSYSKVHSLQLADFNGDGLLDIFAAEMHTSPDSRVTVFEQLPAGGWSEHVLSRAGSHNAKTGLIDGDDLPDIVGANFEQDIRPRIWYNDIGNELSRRRPLDRWARRVIERNLPWSPVFVDAADLDGDERKLPDIVTGGWWFANPGAMDRKWTRRDIGGRLYNMLALVDLDGDGDIDIVGTRGKPAAEGFQWAENHGRGSWAIHSNIPPADGDFLQGAEVGRLTAGGGLEIILSWHNGNRGGVNRGTQRLLVPADPKAEAWTWQKISDTTNEEQIALGDLDGDGDLDIHLGSQWLENEGRSFVTREGLKMANGDPDRVRLADIDADGDLDVIVSAEHTPKGRGNLLWGENRQQGARWESRGIPVEECRELLSLDVADIDGDGDADIVVGEHMGEGRVWIYENEGGGSSWRPHVVDAGEPGIDHHSGTRLRDLDLDGDLDILSIGWQEGKRSLVIYENLASAAPRPEGD